MLDITILGLSFIVYTGHIGLGNGPQMYSLLGNGPKFMDGVILIMGRLG